MCVDNCSKVDLAGADLFFQNGRYSSLNGSAFSMSSLEDRMRILFGMSWIDNHSVF
jgi:hypothetical protein